MKLLLDTQILLWTQSSPDRDAILVATAKVYGLTLVTADRVLIEARACPVLSNL